MKLQIFIKIVVNKASKNELELWHEANDHWLDSLLRVGLWEERG